jgi:predicted nucleotide-binding protein
MADVDEVIAAIKAASLEVSVLKRLKNETGTQLLVDGGQAIVNVFDTGTIQVQGREPTAVKEALGDLLSAPKKRAAPVPTKVFVAYGHDKEARDQLEAMLRRWNLEPVILDQLPSEGATLIEKIERYLKDEEVRFGIVLATPDDEGHPVGKDTAKSYRARQNVVLELGMLLAHLGRPRVAILLKDATQMERPSDIDGLIYLSFERDVAEKDVELAKEMIKQGYEVRLERL